MLDVRRVRDRDEFTRALYGIGQYFGPPAKEDQVDRFLSYFDIDRMHAAFEDGEIVGGAGAYTFDLAIPGGSLPCAGVTVIGVYPTHRRRGILRAMMRAQLDDVHARGEPIAALWASEETIYGRFGYGLAAWAGEIKLPREWSAFVRPVERRGQTRFVTPEEASSLFPAVYEAVRRQRPGAPSRSDKWWELRQLRMPEEQASSPKRFVALELDGEVQGYTIFRIHSGFDGAVSSARLEVVEALATTPHATAELWRFLLDIDWTKTIEAEVLPPDHPLFLLLANPRRMQYHVFDSVWVRLVDVGAALSGREYSSDASIVFEVRDAFCAWNEGRWKLEGGKAVRTEEPAEIALDVDALGSAFLGAVSFAQMRDALRIEELVEGAVRRADTVFEWRPLPWCPEIF